LIWDGKYRRLRKGERDRFFRTFCRGDPKRLKGDKHVLAVGREAKEMLGRTPEIFLRSGR